MKFHKIALDPLEISKKPRPLEIPHYFYVVTVENSTSFLINPWKFHMLSVIPLEIPYPQLQPIPVCFFSGIAQYLAGIITAMQHSVQHQITTNMKRRKIVTIPAQRLENTVFLMMKLERFASIRVSHVKVFQRKRVIWSII